MDEKEAVAKLQELIAANKHEFLMQGHIRRLSVHARSAFIRIVMCLPETMKSPRNFADWNDVKIDPATLDQNVTLDEVRAWMTPKRPDGHIIWLQGFLDRDEVDPFSFDDYLALVRERRRSVLTHLLFVGVPWYSPQYRLIAEAHAEEIVEVLSTAERPLPSPLVDALPAEMLGKLVDALAERPDLELSAPNVRRLRAAIPHAQASFLKFFTPAAKSTKKRDVNYLDLPKELDAQAIEEVLGAVKGKEAHFRRLATQAVIYRAEDGASAVAQFLGHAKRGRLCARLLAAVGAIDAAHAVAEPLAKKKTKTAERVRDLVAAIEKLPTCPNELVAIANQPSGWSLDPTRFLMDAPEPESKSPPHEPTGADVLRRALEDDSHDAEDLEPHQWADLLQVTTISGWKNDLEWAVGAAARRGLLGWGDDPAFLIRAIDRYDLGQSVSLRHSSGGKEMGLYNLLLGADAPVEVMLHALARASEGRGNLVVGQTDRNFTNPLTKWDADDQVPLGLLAHHSQMRRHHRIGADEIDRYPLLEEASSAGARWKSEGQHSAFRFRVTATGATTVTVRFRAGLEFGVKDGRWWQKGLPGNESGGTSIIGDVDPLQVDIESVGSALRLTCNGTMVAGGPSGYLYTGVKNGAGFVEVETDGDIQRVRITGMQAQKIAEDFVELVMMESPKSIQDLLDVGGVSAAHALAIESLLGDDPAVVEAAKTALGGMGGVAEPFRTALGVEKKKLEKVAFAPRPFAECVAVFGASKKGTLKTAEGVRSFDKAVAFGNPSDPKWGDGIAEDTLYLVEGKDDAGGVESVQNLMETSMPALCVWNKKGDGNWAGQPGKWLLLTAAFWPEDDYGEYAEVTLAAWKVAEGVAYAAWKGDRDVLAKVMGLPGGWPSKRSWKSVEVWIGE